MATPESRTLRMIANRSLTSLASSEEVGSSRISTLALITIARAMATSCCIAMEMELSGVCGSMDSRPICAKYFLAASWVFFQSMPKGAALFVAQHHVLTDGKVGAQVHFLIHGGDTGVLCVEGAVELLSLPSTIMEPALILYTPVRALIMVDLPAPFSPIRRELRPGRESNQHHPSLDAREFNRNAFHYDDGVFICHVFALNENEVLSFCDI